jgi:hypothetical protein
MLLKLLPWREVELGALLSAEAACAQDTEKLEPY